MKLAVSFFFLLNYFGPTIRPHIRPQKNHGTWQNAKELSGT